MSTEQGYLKCEVKNINKIRMYIHIHTYFLKPFTFLGQEIIDQYIDFILQCGKDDSKAISMLCQWKDRRSDLWIEKKLYTGKK